MYLQNAGFLLPILVQYKMKKTVLILTAVILNAIAIAAIWFITTFLINDSSDAGITTDGPVQDSTLVHLAFVGDLMCHEPQFIQAQQGNGDYDFDPPFRWVKNALETPDWTVGNLETVFRGTELDRHYSGYPNFNTPDSYASTLKKIGFDAVFTANNHSLDGGVEGLERTLTVLEGYQLPAIGTSYEGTSKTYSFELKGIKFAMLGYTNISNFAIYDKVKQHLSWADTTKIREDIEQVRAEGAEVVIVNFHFGAEFQREPDEKQKALVRYAIAQGADIIVGEHPHVLQPIRKFKASEKAVLDTGIVAFSLGNFYAYQLDRYTNAGMILNVKLRKDATTGKIRIEEDYGIPTFLARAVKDGKRRYLLLPASLAMQRHLPRKLQKPMPEVLNELDTGQLDKMERSYVDTQELMRAYYEDFELY